MNERLKSHGKRVFPRTTDELKLRTKSLLMKKSSWCCVWYFMFFFLVVNRIWRHRRGTKTDSRGAQFPEADGSNRSRSRSTFRTKHARDAVGWRAGGKGTAMGERVHVSTWSESVFGWVQVLHYKSTSETIHQKPLLTVVQLKLNIFIVAALPNSSIDSMMFRRPNWMEIEHERGRKI